MSSCEPPCDIPNGSVTKLVLCIVLPTILGIFFSIQTNLILKHLGVNKGLKYYRAYTIIVISLILILWFGIMSWGVF